MGRQRLVTSVCVAVFGIAALCAPAGATEGPRPTEPTSGADAVEALGDQLPAVAAEHDLSAQELRDLLLNDPTLHVAPDGSLFAIDPVPDGLPEGDAVDADLAIPAADAFTLESRPGADRTIYLDFDGHQVTGSSWIASTGGPCYAEPYDTNGSPDTFNTSERNLITNVWQRVSEDFAPFDVNVTTKDPGEAAIARSSSGDLQYGTRALITRSLAPCANGKTIYQSICPSGCGGYAYIGSFDSIGADHASRQPALIFQNGVATQKNIAEATSHEVGHNIGLNHDGQGCSGCDYYRGHSNWAPIMGAGYYHAVSQWSQGEYLNANNKQDDFAVAASNGLPLRPDDHGDTAASGTVLTAPSLAASGVIGTRGDVDAFVVDVGSGPIQVSATPAAVSPNLDIRLELRNAAGEVVAASDPASGELGTDAATGLGASVDVSVPAGRYALVVDGVGARNPESTGYSDYGSVGSFQLSGTAARPGKGLHASLTNASFERGSSAGWAASGTNTNLVAYQDAKRAKEGAWFAQANTAAAGGSIYQDVTAAPQVGQSSSFSVWLRAADAGGTVKGRLALWGIGTATEAARETPFTVGDAWTLVSVPIDVGTAGHTRLRAQIYLDTAAKSYEIDGGQIVDVGLTNASFERGSSGGWSGLGTGTNLVAYQDPTRAKDGAWFAQANTPVAGAGSIYQDITSIAPQPGQSYSFSVWARSAEAGKKVSGRLALWGMGASTEGGSATAFTVGDVWTLVSVPFDVGMAGHTKLRAQIYLDTAVRSLEIDGGQVIDVGLTNASFERGSSGGWSGLGTGTNLVAYQDPTRAKDGAWFAQANTPVAGAGSIYQDITSIAPQPGQSYSFSVWVRSAVPDTTVTGRLTMFGLGSTTEGTAAPSFTVGTTWTLITVPFDVGTAGHTKLRVQLYLDTAARSFEVDGGQITIGRNRAGYGRFAALPFASWSALVDRFFVDITGTGPTSAQRSTWVTALSTGTKSKGDLIAELRRGTENAANVDPTARLYRAFLGRAPDASGLDFWISRRRAGTWKLTRMADQFAASSEFKRKYGTLTNRQFVTRIYTDVLGRTADPAGVDYWTRQLDLRRRSRGSVMVGFSESTEYQRKQLENTDVAVANILLLDRAAPPAEATAWVARQRAGATLATLSLELVDGAAYAQHIDR